jgi:hypothetical protein
MAMKRMRVFTIITLVMAVVLIAAAFALAAYRRPIAAGHEESEEHEAVEQMLERMGEH